MTFKALGDLPVHRFFDSKLRTDVIFRNSWLPNWAARPIGNQWVLTTAAGSWVFVSNEEYNQLDSIAITAELFDRLTPSFAILHEDNAAQYLRAYGQWAEPHVRHPVHHLIVTTLRCNLACTYCHAAVVPPNAGKEFDLSSEVASAIIDFAMNSRATIQSFEFQGGESLLNGRVLREMITQIRTRYSAIQRSVYLSIQTNATLLDSDWFRFFRNNEVSVGTSLDGDRDTHDSARRFVSGSGSYENVKNKIEKYRLPVLPTVARHNIEKWQSLIDTQLSNNSRTFVFQPVYPINAAAKNWPEIGIEGSDFLRIYDQAIDYVRSLWREDYYPLERRFRLALKKLYTARDVDYADFGNPCGMVHSQIAYHTNGDVYTCDEGRDFPEFKIGNVLSDSYDEVVFGEQTRRLKSLSMPNDPACRVCAYRPFCSACPVYERAVTGELHSKHAGTWHCMQTMLIYDKLFTWISETPALFQTLCDWHQLTK